MAILTVANLLGCDVNDPEDVSDADASALTTSDEQGDRDTGENHVSARIDELNFSAEDEQPLHAYYLCIDACSELVSCWRDCVQGGKVTSCLKSGFPCDRRKYE